MADELNQALPINIAALLAPIPGERPAGTNLRDDESGTSPYYDVRNMRGVASAVEKDWLYYGLSVDARADEGHERVLQAWRQVQETSEALLRQKSKDLEILEWLIESLVRLEGFAGLHAGLVLAAELLETYWDDVHHLVDPDDSTIKGLSFERLDKSLAMPVSRAPLTPPAGDEGPLTLAALRAMHTAGAGMGEADVAALAGGRSFYQPLGMHIRGSIAAWQRIDRTLKARMNGDAPSLEALAALLAELETMVQQAGRSAACNPGALRDTTKSEANERAEQFRPAAEQGDIDAQYRLAWALLDGSSADEIAEGITWLRKVAEQDGAEWGYAKLMLASIYGGAPARHLGSTAKSLKLMPAPEYHEALKWYRAAADAGYSEANGYIGELYERGTPATPRNFGEALQWYTKAAESERGLDYSFDLAEMHFHGRGVKQDYVEAARLYHKVHRSGRAMLRLGWMHENGKGVPQDLAEAHKWFNLAREMGFGGETEADGNAGRLRVESAMSDAQRADAWCRYEQFKDVVNAGF